MHSGLIMSAMAVFHIGFNTIVGLLVDGYTLITEHSPVFQCSYVTSSVPRDLF